MYISVLLGDLNSLIFQSPIYTHTHTCSEALYINTHTQQSLDPNTQISLSMYISVLLGNLNTHIFEALYIHMHTHTYTHTHTHIHTHTHTYTHTHTHKSLVPDFGYACIERER